MLSEPKLESPKPEIPKLKTSKLISPEIRVNKKKLKKLRKDFDELRHKFDKKEIGIEKLFMMLKTMKIFLYRK